MLSEILFHAKGATPLMISLISGNDECAAALVAAGTNLNSQNSRGLTAADLIRRHSGLEILHKALGGRVQGCQKVSLLARGRVGMQF